MAKKKKVPTVEARCPMCKNRVQLVWTGEVVQVIEELTDDDFHEPKLERLSVADVHDPGGRSIRDKLDCINPNCAFKNVPATRENLKRLRPDNKEEREWLRERPRT